MNYPLFAYEFFFYSEKSLRCHILSEYECETLSNAFRAIKIFQDYLDFSRLFRFFKTSQIQNLRKFFQPWINKDFQFYGSSSRM